MGRRNDTGPVAALPRWLKVFSCVPVELTAEEIVMLSDEELSPESKAMIEDLTRRKVRVERVKKEDFTPLCRAVYDGRELDAFWAQVEILTEVFDACDCARGYAALQIGQLFALLSYAYGCSIEVCRKGRGGHGKLLGFPQEDGKWEMALRRDGILWDPVVIDERALRAVLDSLGAVPGRVDGVEVKVRGAPEDLGGTEAFVLRSSKSSPWV